MKRLLFALVLLLAACKKEAIPVAPARETIEVAYVGAPELEVHAKADDASPVVTKFLSGESVSILSRQKEWVELRTTDGSGWAHAADLTNAAGAKAEEANPTPRFRKVPSPVTQPGVHGTVYIEAAVNTEGEVTRVQIITNTTGSVALAEQNAAALKQAKFYPIVQKGEKKDFLYYYRVDY
jgi:TonB family protein